MTEIPRDRYGKPLIIPPGGGKPVPYYRASSFGDVLDDKTNLEKWKIRHVVKGLTARRDLFFKASTLTLDDKWALNQVADQAFEHAGGTRAATTGTSLHTLTELLDRGEELPEYPQEYAADLDAYKQATASFSHSHIEEFMVCDQLQVAGTPDRLSVELLESGVWDDVLTVTDLKTNAGGLGYSGVKYSVQLAIYAHSKIYDPATGKRSDPVMPLNQAWGVIFHMPAGQGTCELYDVDLVRGWELALIAGRVREARRMKDLIRARERAAA